MTSRWGSFALGFAMGAATVFAFRRLKDCEVEEDYERLADSLQAHLHELEARIGSPEKLQPKRARRKASK